MNIAPKKRVVNLSVPLAPNFKFVMIERAATFNRSCGKQVTAILSIIGL